MPADSDSNPYELPSVALNNLPVEAGRVPGDWLVVLTHSLSDYLGGVRFVDGISQAPVPGARVRQLVAAMGGSIALLKRLDGTCALGDASADPEVRAQLAKLGASLKSAAPAPERVRHAPDVQQLTLTPERARAAPASANTADVSDDDLEDDPEALAGESTASAKVPSSSRPGKRKHNR